jgi:hypothetical protein
MSQDNFRSLKIIGFVIFIPFILTAGPLVGLEVGQFFVERWGWPSATSLVLAGFGLLAGVVEAFKLARRALQIESRGKDI